MIFIALPVSYFASFRKGYGLTGLWIGYSLSAFCLTAMYSLLLVKLDWHKIAQEASVSDESSLYSEEDQENSQQYTYSKTAYLDEIHDDDYVNADLNKP